MALDRFSFPRRLIDALPQMPDGLFLAFFLLMLFFVGLMVGANWCLSSHTKGLQGIAVQDRIDTLEQRVRALEIR